MVFCAQQFWTLNTSYLRIYPTFMSIAPITPPLGGISGGYRNAVLPHPFVSIRGTDPRHGSEISQTPTVLEPGFTSQYYIGLIVITRWRPLDFCRKLYNESAHFRNKTCL